MVKLLYSINMAAAAPMMGASSLASAVGAIARPVEEVVVKVTVEAGRVLPRTVLGAMVVWLLVVPGMVVAGMVVPDSTEVTVVLTGPVLVLLPEEVDPAAAVEALEAADEAEAAAEEAAEAAEEAAEAAEEAALSTLLATEEAAEPMLEAIELPAAAADETAAEAEAAAPVLVDWPRASPERRPRAITARVLTFILMVVCFKRLSLCSKKEEQQRYVKM
jgi:hypothetical protein